MVHPFDPKSVVLARHAQHVVLVHRGEAGVTL